MATTLSLEQFGWLLEQSKDPEKIGITYFEKYVVSKINKMPERQVGKIIRIETLYVPRYFSPMLRGLNVNRRFKGGKYWSCLFEPDMINDLTARKIFIKDLAVQLRRAFIA